MNNEKFLNQTGLSYYHDRAKTLFENKIEKVKVNGDAVIPVNKEVDINVATVTSVDGADGKTSIVSIKDSLIDDGISFVRGTDAVAVKFGEYSQNPVRVDLPTKDYVDNAVKIDKIKVNGNEQTITNKEVNIETPEFTISDLEGVVKEVHIKNKIDGQTAETLTLSEARDNCVRLYAENSLIQDTPLDITLASKDYVNANGGKIDKIKVNGTEQTITNKEVDITVDKIDVSRADEWVKWTHVTTNGNYDASLTKTSTGATFNIDEVGSANLVDKNYVDTNFRTETQVQTQIDDALADITGMDFVLVDTLPATGEKGKIYLVPNGSAGSNVKDEYIWLTPEGGTAYFEKIGSTDVDLSDYYNNTNLVAITTAEIDALFA